MVGVEILARMVRAEHESHAELAQRCALLLLHSRISEDFKQVYRARPVEGFPAIVIDHRWSLACSTKCEELHSDECLIIRCDGRMGFYGAVVPLDMDQYNRAPVNVVVLPRQACRLSLTQFIREAHARSAYRETFEVFLDGVTLGMVQAMDDQGALRKVHRREVVRALTRCCSPIAALARDALLPSVSAMSEYGYLRNAEAPPGFANWLELIAMDLNGWTAKFRNQALREGWCLVVGDAGLEVSCDGPEPLRGELDAWNVIRNGADPCHVVARTLMASMSPYEFARIDEAVRDRYVDRFTPTAA